MLNQISKQSSPMVFRFSRFLIPFTYLLSRDLIPSQGTPEAKTAGHCISIFSSCDMKLWNTRSCSCHILTDICINYPRKRNGRCDHCATDWIFNVRSIAAINSSWHLKMEPIGCPETSPLSSQRCVTSQKSKDLIYTVAKAWHHAK
jgi:hypothetical protein